jgi:ligand-binding sensor domain-containing protein
MIKKILFFLAVLINFVLSAQNSIPYYYHLSKQNGMPTEVVYDVYQDRKGFIWLSTEQGLFRYDGKNYQNYALDEQTSKSGSCISEDNQ